MASPDVETRIPGNVDIRISLKTTLQKYIIAQHISIIFQLLNNGRVLYLLHFCLQFTKLFTEIFPLATKQELEILEQKVFQILESRNPPEIV